MYAKDGTVTLTRIGELKSFKRALKRLEKTIDTTNVPIVMLFRITTSGGTSPEKCHPFPVSEKLPL